MILLIGNLIDPSMCYFHDYLKENKVDFVFMDLADVGENIHFDSRFLRIGKKRYQHNQFSGVYVRLLCPSVDDIDKERYYNNTNFLEFLLQDVYENVVNKPYSWLSNESKPYQLKTFDNGSLKIPDSEIVANQGIPVLSERMIYKSVSGFRSEVLEMRDKDHDREINSPVLFQELIDGVNMRIHVIKESVFPVSVTTDAIDYRYPNNKTSYHLDTLPTDIADSCISITKQAGLVFSGVDLIRKDDEYYLLEINPCPGYSGFEKHFEEKVISNKLCEVLHGE